MPWANPVAGPEPDTRYTASWARAACPATVEMAPLQRQSSEATSRTAGPRAPARRVWPATWTGTFPSTDEGVATGGPRLGALAPGLAGLPSAFVPLPGSAALSSEVEVKNVSRVPV